MTRCTVLERGRAPDGAPSLRVEADGEKMHVGVPFFVWDDAEVGGEVHLPLDEPDHPDANVYVRLAW